MSAPVETKVTASTAGAVGSAFVVWVLGAYVFHDDVPLPVTALVAVIVPGIVTFVAGWLAPHTPRRDLRVEER